MIKFLSFLLAMLLTPLFGAMADVACPSGYTQVIEDVVYTSYGDSCPNGDTKLGGEYGEDSILNCIGAQSSTVPICTYYAESCQSGMSFDGMAHQSCPRGSYCDGTGTATPGVAGCAQTCPQNSTSQSGAASVTDCVCNDGYYMNNGVCEICPAGYACSDEKMTQCENGTYSVAGQSICTSCPPVKNVHGAGLAFVQSVNAAESIDACEAGYMFMSQYIAQLVQQYEELPEEWNAAGEYNPDSDANKRGAINVYCKYDAKSQDYVADCNSVVWTCEGGYYADDSGQEGAYPPSYTSNTLDDIIKNSCRPVGENYWSPSYHTYISGPDDNITFDEAMTTIYDKHPCPENSSTRGDTTAQYCTCDDGYTVTGTVGGSIQTTTNACIKFMCEDGYYQNGNTCEICPVGSYCANNTKTACDTGYTTDNTGATSESQCYTTCTKQCTQQTCPENATCRHGTTTTAGKQYVGGTCNAASSTCEMTVNCNNGYDKQDGEIVLVSQTPLVPVDYMDGGDNDASINAGGNLSGNSDFGLTESNTWAAHFEHGTVYGRASCQPDADAGAAYVINYNTLYDLAIGLTNIEDFETKLAAISGEAKAKYMADAFRGVQDGTTTAADFGSAVFVVFGIEYNASYSTTDNGQYCYCQMTEYSPTNESKQSVVGNWVYLNDYITSGDCANKCANMCANGLRINDTPFNIGLRAAVFDSMRAENTAVCVAKTIDVPAGYYLPANTTEYIQCPENSYCPGVSGITLHETQNQGLKPCPSNYMADKGATSESQCYTTCEVACTQQECPDNATCTHDATTTTGKQYVGGTCDAEQTTCNINIQCNENFELSDGKCKLVPEFTVTTTDMVADSTFWFGISAAGTFYLDCGEGGTPVDTEEKQGAIGIIKIASPINTGKVKGYGCKYTNAGEHTIHIAGQATKYSTKLQTNSVSYIPALTFSLGSPYTHQNIKGISGSLGHIFGTVGDGSDASKQPSFASTFSGQTNLVGTIPENLFDGVHGKPITGMFQYTFSTTNLQGTIPSGLFKDITGNAPYLFQQTFSTTNLQDTIPSGLFKGITGGAEYSFNATFANCPSLTAIGEGLFDNITDGAPYMFLSTFYGCTGIKSVHEYLFKNITTGADGMFWSTFTNTGLTSVPSKLFQNVRGSAFKMFRATFSGATSLTEVPTDLFKNITEPAEELFALTFKGTGLTSIPNRLFKNIEGKPTTSMFLQTFANCINLKGYVPTDTFEKLDSADFNPSTMADIFADTALDTACPADMHQYITGFESAWNSKVSCIPCPDGYVSEAGSTSESQCYVTCTKQCTQQTCPENSVNCTHGNEISSGRQYYGSSCDATEIVCDIDFSCSVGYDKLSFADTLVRNMDAIYDSAEYDDYCQLNNTGNSCDTLSAGQYMWHFDTSYGSPISSGQVQTTCTDNIGNDTDPQSRINYNADFDIQSSGANCWERVLYLNDSPVSSSWIYNQTYDSAEDCAAYCGFSKPMSVGYALAVATNANLCAPHEYTVTYDCNGGTGNTTDTATYKTTFTPRKDVCERNGYKFIGWTLNDASVSDSFVWDYTNDQTLIATWEQMSAECKPGEYLPANATECKPCEENNYCPGGTYNIGTTDIGMNPCHDGSMSNSGATHITQCYINKPCGKYTDITTVCTYNTDTSDFTDCAECSIDTSCPYNQELVNGKCAPCNRDNALDYHKTGNCMVSECEQGFYPYMQQCMPEKIECDAPKANVAYKYWDVANRAYGHCIITECIDDEYHIEANACVPNTQSCDVEHGIGEQEWDFEQNKWGACVAVQCDSGYTTDQSLTNDTLNGQCGRCSNMYVDDELAVSTYISECEIASCMYQGEKYILENNECVLICDERSDETGSRYWNGNKCVHECAEGYSIWE